MQRPRHHLTQFWLTSSVRRNPAPTTPREPLHATTPVLHLPTAPSSISFGAHIRFCCLCSHFNPFISHPFVMPPPPTLLSIFLYIPSSLWQPSSPSSPQHYSSITFLLAAPLLSLCPPPPPPCARPPPSSPSSPCPPSHQGCLLKSSTHRSRCHQAATSRFPPPPSPHLCM